GPKASGRTVWSVASVIGPGWLLINKGASYSHRRDPPILRAIFGAAIVKERIYLPIPCSPWMPGQGGGYGTTRSYTMTFGTVIFLRHRLLHRSIAMGNNW